MKKTVTLTFGTVIAALIMAAFAATAYSCFVRNGYTEEAHYIYCPNDGCIPFVTVGDSCSYCDGSGVDIMPDYGGCVSYYFDSGFDCGYWWRGTCNLQGACANAVRLSKCMQLRYMPSC
jgi:hypothetical protein